MTASFIGDAELGAGVAPFLPVRRDPAPARARLREQVRQLVAQGAIDLIFTVSAKPAVEKDASVSGFRPAGGRTQASRPFHPDFSCQLARAVSKQEFTGERFQARIAAGRF